MGHVICKILLLNWVSQMVMRFGRPTVAVVAQTYSYSFCPSFGFKWHEMTLANEDIKLQVGVENCSKTQSSFETNNDLN